MKLATILSGQLYQRGHMEQYTLPEKQRVLDAHNITLIVGLFKRCDPDLPAVYNYVHVEFPDGKTIAEDAYDLLAAQVASHVQGGRGAALVHCYGGRNRSGLLNALVVRQLTGCTGSEAVAIVKKARRGSLVNPVFAAYLETLGAP